MSGHHGTNITMINLKKGYSAAVVNLVTHLNQGPQPAVATLTHPIAVNLLLLILIYIPQHPLHLNNLLFNRVQAPKVQQSVPSALDEKLATSTNVNPKPGARRMTRDSLYLSGDSFLTV